MKKVILVFLVLVLVMLSACTANQAQKTYVCSDGSTVSDPQNCPVKEQRTTGTVDVVDTTPSIPDSKPSQDYTPAAREIIGKASKANIVAFNYYRSDDPTTQDAFVASRTHMKRTLVNKIVYSPKEQYDTIYFNFGTETAKAYCETQSAETCPDRDKSANVDFDKFRVLTPYQWLDMIETADVTGRSEQIDGRTGKEISFSYGSKDGTMFLDSFYGLPLEVTYDGVTYEYQNSKINLNKDTELTHQ